MSKCNIYVQNIHLIFQQCVQNSRVYEIKTKMLYVLEHSYNKGNPDLRMYGRCTFQHDPDPSEQVRDRGTIQISGSCGPEEQDSGEKEGPEAR